MAATASTTTRRGVIGAVAAVSAVSLCGTAAAKPHAHQPDELRRLLKQACFYRDEMFQARLSYADLQVEGRLIAFREAKEEYEWAINELLMAGEDL